MIRGTMRRPFSSRNFDDAPKYRQCFKGADLAPDTSPTLSGTGYKDD
jgi:hypothetical protein